jgi:hypothetical protein
MLRAGKTLAVREKRGVIVDMLILVGILIALLVIALAGVIVYQRGIIAGMRSYSQQGNPSQHGPVLEDIMTRRYR